MAETFKVVRQYRTSSREYVEVTCEEGHTLSFRKDTLHKRVVCTVCRSKYSNTKEYQIVDGMKQRCYNSKNIRYKDYGGRGISVCERWAIPSYIGTRNFLQDMGECPEGMTLDRVDVNGNYEPNNCRWATASTQGYNQRMRNTNTSGRTGVCSFKSGWQVRITVENKEIYLGYFTNKDLAIKAREEAEIKYYGKIKE